MEEGEIIGKIHTKFLPVHKLDMIDDYPIKSTLTRDLSLKLVEKLDSRLGESYAPVREICDCNVYGAVHDKEIIIHAPNIDKIKDFCSRIGISLDEIRYSF